MRHSSLGSDWGLEKIIYRCESLREKEKLSSIYLYATNVKLQIPSLLLHPSVMELILCKYSFAFLPFCFQDIIALLEEGMVFCHDSML